MSLFDQNAKAYYRSNAPLADRLRPRDLDEFEGQHQLVGEDRFLRRMIETDRLRSLVFWGPPGTGKTTLARIIAHRTGRRFIALSAVTSGVADLKQVLKLASERLRMEQSGTLLFIDEIHRFNKSQQDALLHGVEDGTVTLIGATTENPSFEINGALLSRTQVLVLEPLDSDALLQVLDRALSDRPRGLGERELSIEEDAKQRLVQLAAGDARSLLNFLELSALLAETRETTTLDRKLVDEATGQRAVLYDKGGDQHYDIASALIKSMRGSDPDAALYYLARMLEGGEDPMFIARRLVIFASEDVGNADPRALQLSVSAKDAVHFIGMPEGYYPLSQCVTYLACAPKSNSVGTAYKTARNWVREHGALPVPMHIRNAPTGLMKELGHGDGYRYPHDESKGYSAGVNYLPDALVGKRAFVPGERGFEKRMAEWLAFLNGRPAPSEDKE